MHVHEGVYGVTSISTPSIEKRQKARENCELRKWTTKELFGKEEDIKVHRTVKEALDSRNNSKSLRSLT